MAEAKAVAKISEKAEKPSAKKSADSISKQISKVLKSAVIGVFVVLIMAFILGEAYAFYALRSNSAALLLWLPVLALVAVLVYKVFD